MRSAPGSAKFCLMSRRIEQITNDPRHAEFFPGDSFAAPATCTVSSELSRDMGHPLHSTPTALEPRLKTGHGQSDLGAESLRLQKPDMRRRASRPSGGLHNRT